MIKKLSQKIFWLIMVSLSIVILGIIIFSSILNCKNIINTSISVVDKFVITVEAKKNNIKDYKMNPNINVDGLYYVIIENNKILTNSEVLNNIQLKEYIVKLSNGNKESGIIGNYIYKFEKIKENTNRIILIEDENAVLQIKLIFIFAICLSSLSLFGIYIIARKVSKSIVKPVEDTFEKQKQFISDASHELKTPLAIIEANADVLENEIGNNNKWIGYIQNEIESMDKLINELLLLAKVENIDNLRKYEQIDLSKEVEIILSMFESMAYEKNIIINSDIQENIMLSCDKEDIKHIISTLVDNAIKHTETEKEIKIELSKEKGEIIIQVKNMGEPIPKEEKQKIFERFYRIDKARNRSEKRYGLGLAIAKSTVQKYKGKIEVFYEKGFTVFKVIIPV